MDLWSITTIEKRRARDPRRAIRRWVSQRPEARLSSKLQSRGKRFRVKKKLYSRIREGCTKLREVECSNLAKSKFRQFRIALEESGNVYSRKVNFDRLLSLRVSQLSSRKSRRRGWSWRRRRRRTDRRATIFLCGHTECVFCFSRSFGEALTTERKEKEKDRKALKMKIEQIDR